MIKRRPIPGRLRYLAEPRDCRCNKCRGYGTDKDTGFVTRGFFAIGIANGKTEENIGTLWRSAHLYGAAFVFTVGKRYKKQSSDTPHTPLHTPLLHFKDMDDLIEHLPHSCPLIGVELAQESRPLSRFSHPERAAYLLGAEDHGLTNAQIERCHRLVQLEALRSESMNVAVAGSILMYDRHVRGSVRMKEVMAS